MDNDYDYDITSADSLANFAKSLQGRTLAQVRYLPPGVQNLRNKGMLGGMVEEYYFKYVPGPNRDHDPDFAEAGVELKVTGVVLNHRKDSAPYKAKERLVLTMISYIGLVEEEWTTSTLLKKCQLMLLLFYLYQKELPPAEQTFVMPPLLWKFPKTDLEIIERDWKIIQQKVFEGKAHELSEGDTFYLGACRKGTGGVNERLREQPFSNVRAKSRAFSLKQSYVTSMINTHWQKSREQELIQDEKDAELGIEEIAKMKFKNLHGKTLAELAEDYGIDKNSHNAKSYFSSIALRILGTKKRRLPEFDRAGIIMKTIRLKANGMPKEAISFPAFDFVETLSQSWDESALSEALEQKFFLVIFQYDEDDELRFKKVMFWNMPYSDRLTAQAMWLKTQDAIRESEPSRFPKISDGKVIHVRPHGRDAKDTNPLPNGSLYPKQGFWLNQKYIKQQLED